MEEFAFLASVDEAPEDPGEEFELEPKDPNFIPVHEPAAPLELEPASELEAGDNTEPEPEPDARSIAMDLRPESENRQEASFEVTITPAHQVVGAEEFNDQLREDSLPGK